MAKKAPGRAHREGVSIVELMDMFPTEKAATEWFETIIWPDGRHCPKCGSVRTREASHAKMPYWCTDCRSYFSVKTGTAMQRSKIPLRKWAIAIYLCLTSLKSVSSMKLQRDIGVSQPTAWFMLHRIREAWAEDDDDQFDGPVEVDETYFGGERRNMSLSKRKAMNKSRGPAGKTAVVGVKDRDSNEVRAEVVRGRTARRCKALYASTPNRARRSIRTMRRPTGGCRNSTMRPSITRSPNMSGVRRTPTGSSPFGPCSSGRMTARSTR